MAAFVLDSFAMLAFFRNEQGVLLIKKLLNEAAEGKHELYMSSINIGEAYYITYRKDSPEKAEIIWKALQEFPIKIITVENALAYKAANIKARCKLSYTDAIAAAIAIKHNATLITGDKEFDSLKAEKGFKVKYI